MGKTNNLKSFSIVTVVKNNAEGLKETIESVINQKFQNLEYIVVCGESDDDTYDVLGKYKKHITKYIIEKDEGIYFAMNKALKYCNSDYINFLNSGDTFTSEDTLDIISREIDDNTDIFCGSIYCVDTSNNKVLKDYSSILQPLDHMFCFHQATFSKKNIFEKYAFDTQFKVSADYDWALKCYHSELEFQFSKIPIVNFLESGFSKTNRITARIEDMFIQRNYLEDSKEIYSKNSFTRFLSYKKNNNRYFSRLFNDILNQFEKLRLSEKTLVLFGFGQLGRALHAMFPEKFARIYDKNAKELTSKFNLKIYYPEEIFIEPNEVILISALGHEKDITEF